MLQPVLESPATARLALPHCNALANALSDERIAALLREHAPMFALAGGDAQVVWATGTALTLFGAHDLASLRAAVFDAGEHGAQRLSQLARAPNLQDRPRLERLRFFLPATTGPLTCMIQHFGAAGGGALLVVAVLGMRSCSHAGAMPETLTDAAGFGPQVPFAEGRTAPALPELADPERAPAGIAEAGAQLAERFGNRRAPRFIWQTDAAHRLVAVGPELHQLLHGSPAPSAGDDLMLILAGAGIDPAGAARAALAGCSTWSGVETFWPICGGAVDVPVRLGATPQFDAVQKFAGYRGFGVILLDRLAGRHGAGDAENATLTALQQILPISLNPVAAPPRTLAQVDESDAKTVHQQMPPARENAMESPQISENLDVNVGVNLQSATADTLLSLQHATGQAVTPGSYGTAIPETIAVPMRVLAARPQTVLLRKSAELIPAAEARRKVVALIPASAAGGMQPVLRHVSPEETITLSSHERQAFRDIARALGARMPDEDAGDGAPLQAPNTPPVPFSDPDDDSLEDQNLPGPQGLPLPHDEVESAPTAQAIRQDVRQHKEQHGAPHFANPIITLVGHADGAHPDADHATGLHFSEPDMAAGPDADPTGDADELDEEPAAAADSRSIDDSSALPPVLLPSGDTAAVAEDAPSDPGSGVNAIPLAQDNDASERTRHPIAAMHAAILASDLAQPAMQEEDSLHRNASQLLDRLPVGIVVCRGEVPIYINATQLDLLGYDSADEFYAQGGLARMFRGRQPATLNPADLGGTVPIVAADGEVLSVDARLQSISWDSLPATLITFRRAAEPEALPRLRAAEMDLRTREAELHELHAILDTATDGVAVIDGGGRILSLNRSAQAVFGYDQKEVVGEPFALLFEAASQTQVEDYLARLKGDGPASLLNDGREVQGRERQGGTMPLYLTLGRIGPGDVGNVVNAGKFCAVLRDLSPFRRTERELGEARRQAEQASALKSDFLAKVSHEIRTPLNSILGFTEVIMDERLGPVGNDRYKEYLKDIHTSGSHVLSLVNDLLDLSKIEAGKADMTFVAVDANRVIAEAVALMQPQAAKVRVITRLSLAAKLPAVVADERSLRQIVLNLLSNAIKFTDPGGQVIVSTTLTESGTVAIRVKDTGIGMNEDEIGAALEPFRQIATTRKTTGTGLGLPLTKALIEANRASMSIRSRRNEGTLVEVLFPSTRVLAE